MEGQPTATLLVNPAARRVAKSGLDPARIAWYLDRRGLAVEVVTPASPMEATDAARLAARRGDRFLFALGGDGTLRDCAGGLAGSETALAALPGGTVNIWCTEAGIPRGLRAALDCHLSGQRLRMDLGYADGQPFLLMASAGWDAAVARAVWPRVKRRFGDLAYVARAATMAPWLRTTPARWRSGLAIDEHPLAMIVISNTRLYGGRIRFTPGAVANDGLLDFAALCPGGLGATLRLAMKSARSRVTAGPGAVVGRVAELAIETPGIPFQLDGDFAGETPATFRVAPRALVVSVPAGALPPILAPRQD